ncbi:WXG100 family type VII secretion target [Clostridium acidisoli DSM 12555]|jgi:WXG100 family type VII secretion target|uniref:ESAT-6-like protein n=1 Tax=Clostridium acidisoli DSM 12555 TaxID=1121291 RepID=A0A1W1XYG9_9CLOT|nr:WXG100 family type VII secretion target [Clostridium acidisoli]SMC29009.1 WXG100 family type VII secretion target [Clostridium acidisoli DSM 12555]
MASSKITITPQELTNSAGKFKRGSQTTAQLLSSLRSEVQRLESTWQGASQSAFFQKFDQLKKPLDEFVTVLDEINQQLTGVAKAMQDADNQIASKLR